MWIAENVTSNGGKRVVFYYQAAAKPSRWRQMAWPPTELKLRSKSCMTPMPHRYRCQSYRCCQGAVCRMAESSNGLGLSDCLD